MGYSGLFSPDEEKYPVECIHERITGEPCPSCGMSHAFSLIVRGRVNEALQWNGASVRVFSFFIIQLIMRLTIGLRCFYSDRHPGKIAVADAFLSSIMALVAFYPFLRAVWITLTL